MAKYNSYYAIATAIIAQFHSTSAIDTSNCEPIEKLGPNNLDRYNYSLDMDIDSGCSYELKIKFKHDESLPVPPTNGSQCNPAIGAIASDGLPYLKGRWAYESIPRKMKKATGIDHISIDFNPCGHPPADVFTIPHYDLHIYLESPEYRRCMTCTSVDFGPVCDPDNQSTPSSHGFFNVATVAAGPNAGKLANMPDGFDYAVYDNVPLMGGHSWDTSTQPKSAAEWVKPIWIMGSYDGEIIDYEPMVPLSFVSGSEDKTYEESLTYVGQTITELPSKYTVDYNADSGVTTMSFVGKSAVCIGKDGKSPKQPKTGNKSGKEGKDGKSPKQPKTGNKSGKKGKNGKKL